ncbi:MATE family efflux transporter [Spirochaetia bacterium]|nr:MATE family efflux transporter [Spirochaetia bacterium]
MLPEKNAVFSKENLRRLIIPLIIEQTLALTVGLIDTIMVSFSGESAVSGVSLVDNITVLIINLFTALATGGAIVAAQYLGAKDKKNSERAAKQLIIITVFFSLLVMILCLFFRRHILNLVFGNVEPEVMRNALIYFFITAFSFPFIALFNAAASLFRCMGNSKVSMINAFIMNIINIVFNAVFIYGMKLGVAGAAYATVISRIVASITMICMLRNRRLAISVRSYSLKDTSFLMIKRILNIGIPNGLENSIFQIGKIIMTSFVAGFGTSSITAHAIGNSIAGVGVIPGQAMSMALITVVAQCVGAKEYDQADTYIKHLMKQAYIYVATLNIAILVLLKPILSLCNLSGETFNLAYKLLLIHGIGAIFIWVVSFTLPNAFRAAGDVRFPMVVSISSMFIFRIGFSFVFSMTFHIGVLSVWFAMIIDWVFRSVCFLLRWKSGKWKKTAL